MLKVAINQVLSDGPLEKYSNMPMYVYLCSLVEIHGG